MRRRVTLDLSRTTLVGDSAPAIIVGRGGDLLVKGGQVSTSSRDANALAKGMPDAWRVGVAIEVQPGGSIRFESVDVIGDIAGPSDFTGEWHLPLVLPLPNLPPRARSLVRMRLVLPHEAEVSSDIEGVGPTQTRIGPGAVELGLDIDARDAEHGVLLDGWVRFVARGLVRRMRLRARMVQGSPAPSADPIWEAGLYEHALREGALQRNRIANISRVTSQPTPPGLPVAPSAGSSVAPSVGASAAGSSVPAVAPPNRPTTSGERSRVQSGLGGAFAPKSPSKPGQLPANVAASAPPAPTVPHPPSPPTNPPSEVPDPKKNGGQKAAPFAKPPWRQGTGTAGSGMAPAPPPSPQPPPPPPGAAPSIPSPSSLDPVPGAHGAPTSPSAPKSAGLSQIFRTGSDRIGTRPPASTPMHGSELSGALRGTPEPAATPPVSPLEIPATIPVAEEQGSSPEGSSPATPQDSEVGPHVGTSPEVPKKPSGGVSSIFRRGKPSS